MMRYAIYDGENNLVANSLLDGERDLFNVTLPESRLSANGKSRYGVIEGSAGRIWAVSADPDFVRSSQKFKNTARCILDSLPFIKQAIEAQQASANKNTARLIHNLTSLNAHNIQEIYSLIPQEEISGQMRGHVDYVRRIIGAKPVDASYVLLRIAKNNAAMKAEFSVFKKLFNPLPEMRPSYHVLHKVLMNVLYLFFSDFTDKKVDINIERSELREYFDYESLHVALYHLMDNAAKYTKANSSFEIRFEAGTNTTSVVLRMTSIGVLDSEIDRIYDEGFSGSLATKLGKAGNGIGMGLIKRILEMNRGTLIFRRNSTLRVTEFGIDFEVNEFVLNLPAQQTRRANDVH
jgi:signal transduction histidine kinase